MKKERLIHNAILILFVAVFPVGFFTVPAQAAIGDPCQTLLDNSDPAPSSGTCVDRGSCSGSSGFSDTCGSGGVCCVGVAGSVPCQTRLDNSDPTLSSGTCTAANSCGGGSTGFSSSCSTGQVCCVGGTGTATGGGGFPSGQDPGGFPKGQTGSQATVNFTNPLEFNTVEEVLTKLLSTLQGIIVTLALVFLVIGAILYIISAGDEGRMETGKKAITAAMIGLAIGLAAPSFLKEIGEVLGWGETNSALVDSAPTLTDIALRVLHFLLSIVGILAIIMLVIGGLTYLTAAGDEERVETGKKIVKYSIIGIIIAFGALVIVAQIANFFT